jgi:hypothetical protein
MMQVLLDDDEDGRACMIPDFDRFFYTTPVLN